MRLVHGREDEINKKIAERFAGGHPEFKKQMVSCRVDPTGSVDQDRGPVHGRKG